MLFALSADMSNSQSDFCGKVPFPRVGHICIWRQGSASILGMTRTNTLAPILMYWAGLSRIASTGVIRPK